MARKQTGSVMPKLSRKAEKKIKPKIRTRPSDKFTIKKDEKSETLIKNLKYPTHLSAYTCCWKSCSENFNTALDLDRHLAQHLENEDVKIPYRCHWDTCIFSCNCLQELWRHVHYHGYHSALLEIGREECQKAEIPHCGHASTKRNILPDLKIDFKCLWSGCDRPFTSIVEFQDHVAQHSSFDYDMLKTPEVNQPKGRCRWHLCSQIFENKYRLVEHVRKHTNQKLLGCYQCGELFRTKTTLFDHCRRQAMNNTQKYQCGQCFKFFATEKLLRNHVVVHVNCYKCSMCDMTCNSTNSLAQHIRYRHVKDRPVGCSECEYRCVTRSDLARHNRHAHSKVMQRCGEPGCNYTVKTYNSLRRHYLEVHANSPSIYLCHCCDKVFKYGKHLSTHLITKHNFQLPSGHKRFTYKVDENGFYSLETTRIESLEVTRQVLSPVRFEMSELTQGNNYEIVTIATSGAVEEAEPLQKVVITVNCGD